MGKVLIKNIDKIISGDIKKGIIVGDAILIENGLFSGIGMERELDTKGVELTIDARGMQAIPGLIDSHSHVRLEDFHPTMAPQGWMTSSLQSGVTTLISAHTQTFGEQLDPAFVKAFAILAERKWKSCKPLDCLKVHAGTITLVDGLTESDFKEMAEQGVHLISEIGMVGLAQAAEIKQYCEWARKYKMIVSIHFGGRMVPGSTAPPPETIIEIKPDFVAHTNGGPTAPSLHNAERLVKETQCCLEVIFSSGNIKMMYEIARMLKERGELQRLIFGTDSPTAGGWIPIGIHNLITHLASFNQVPAQDAIACATGNTADCFRLNTGKIEVGREADMLIIDAPLDSAAKDALEAIELGDCPGQAMVMVDGQIIALWGKGTRRPRKQVTINGIEYDWKAYEDWALGELPSAVRILAER